MSAARKGNRLGWPRWLSLSYWRTWSQLRFTREGRIFILLTLGVGAAAVNTGNNLLYLVLGMLLSFIVLSGVMSEIVLRGVRPRRSLPTQAWAGEPCLVEIALTNDKSWLPSYSIEVEDVAVNAPTDRRCYFLKVAPSSTEAAAYRRVPARRGRMRFTTLRLSTRYPFAIFEKLRRVEQEAELLVYPRPDRRARAELGAGRFGAFDATARRGPGSEVAGLRDYVPGDPARQIHWRRSASLGRLVVRERATEQAPRLTIALETVRPADARISDAAFEEAFEEAVRRAAGIALDALERGATVCVATREGRSPWVRERSAPDPLLRFLALVEPLPEQEELPPLPKEASVQAVAPQLPIAPVESEPAEAPEAEAPEGGHE